MDFEVELTGGAPWGFRIQGGREFHSPIRINFLKPGGKAGRSKELKVGDVVVQINNTTTQNMTHTQAEQAIKRAGSSLKLVVNRKEKPAAPEQPTPPVTEQKEEVKPAPVLPLPVDTVPGVLKVRKMSSTTNMEPSVPAKEKDPDWYKSMLRNFQSTEPTAKPKVPKVLSKASVYEQEVEKINQYNAERSRRPHRQSLTGRGQKSAHVLKVAQSQEKGSPLRQYDEFVIDSTPLSPPPTRASSISTRPAPTRSGFDVPGVTRPINIYSRGVSEPCFSSLSYTKPPPDLCVFKFGEKVEERVRGRSRDTTREIKESSEDSVFSDDNSTAENSPVETSAVEQEKSAAKTIAAETSAAKTEKSAEETSAASAEVSAAKTSVAETSAAETSAAEASATETSATETSAGEASAGEASVAEPSVAEPSAAEPSAAEASEAVAASAEASAADAASAEKSTAEASAAETSAAETSAVAANAGVVATDTESEVSEGEVEQSKVILMTRHISESESEGEVISGVEVELSSTDIDMNLSSEVEVKLSTEIDSTLNGKAGGTQILLTAHDTHKLADEVPSLQTSAFIMSPEFV